MTVFINGVQTDDFSALPLSGIPAVYFIPTAKATPYLTRLGFEQLHLAQRPKGESSRFESHQGFDAISLGIPCKEDAKSRFVHIDIYLTENGLLFIYDSCPAIHYLIEKIREFETEGENNLPLELVLFWFFNILTEDDSAFLQGIEEEIAALEDSLIEDKNIDYTTLISALRKKLLLWKRYYETLFDLLVDLEENRNGLLSQNRLHSIHIITNRADRLSHSVLNLRDYVTQVREAYQAQIDISLNQTMKLFTVVTTIFLPLSLIAGWYGMNLMMPEYLWKYSYLVVVILCAAVVIGCIAYFKKHRWF